MSDANPTMKRIQHTSLPNLELLSKEEKDSAVYSYHHFVENLRSSSNPLLELVCLTDEERRSIYSVVNADLDLEKDVLMKPDQIQVLYHNPYLFNGSHVVKAWLDASMSTARLSSRQESILADISSPNTISSSETIDSLDHGHTQESSTSTSTVSSPSVKLYSSQQHIAEGNFVNTKSLHLNAERLFMKTFDLATNCLSSVDQITTRTPEYNEVTANVSEFAECVTLETLGLATNCHTLVTTTKDNEDKVEVSESVECSLLESQADPAINPIAPVTVAILDPLAAVAYKCSKSQSDSISSQVVTKPDSNSEMSLPEVTIWTEDVGVPPFQTVRNIRIVPCDSTESDALDFCVSDEEDDLDSSSMSSPRDGIRRLGKLRKIGDDFRGSTKSLSSFSSAQNFLSRVSLRRNSLRRVSSPSTKSLLSRRVSKYKFVLNSHAVDQMSEVTVSRGAKGNYQISGDVFIKLLYKEQLLYITISEAHNLAATGKNGTSNPYVKVCLLPELKSSKKKTTVVRKTLNPVFEETFQYIVPSSALSSKAIWLTVWSKQRWRGIFLGEKIISLSSIRLADTHRKWYRLCDYSEMDACTLHTQMARTLSSSELIDYQ